VSAPLRLLVWSSIPTHHQSSFLNALRARGFDVVVHYLHQVDAGRIDLGWASPATLPAGERYVPHTLSALESCPDWRDRIHIVPGYNSLFLLRLAHALSRNGVAWVHWSEHSWPRLRARITFAVKRYYGMLANRHALGALAIGELARQEFVRWGIAEKRIRFLPYAVPGFGDLLPTAEVPAQPGVRFLFLGQLCHRKGTDVLLRAMRVLLDEHPGARLELSGVDRSNGAYALEAERLGLRAAVTFGESVPADRVGEVLKRCDVFILPSRHDGWGVVLNEAASLGKAIIASDACGSAHHLVMEGVNGFRVPPENVAALAAAMSSYCREPALAARHGAQSLRLFQEFTPARNAQRLEEALHSLRRSA
jgi:glycosyltransferase involved in cell wall biosynthesis